MTTLFVLSGNVPQVWSIFNLPLPIPIFSIYWTTTQCFYDAFCQRSL